jgi:hypothetical protein
LEMKIRQSSFRRWLQQKCKKSKIFRYTVMLGTMAISVAVARLVRDLLKKYLSEKVADRMLPSSTSK